MTVSEDSSAPLFAVVGATGQQGRSVIDALAASNSPFRVRAVTRDASKADDLKSLGVEIATADMDNVASLTKAFSGATYVFGVTVSDYSQHPVMEKVSSIMSANVDALVSAHC